MAEIEKMARRDENKRKAEAQDKQKRSKKRKLEKLLNWGMEDGDVVDNQVEETLGVKDWVIKKQVPQKTKCCSIGIDSIDIAWSPREPFKKKWGVFAPRKSLGERVVVHSLRNIF